MSALLEVAGLSVSFGGLKALDQVGFEARAGEITALIGPNGSGKTTAINAVTGVVRPEAGSARFEGREILGLPDHLLPGLGLARTFQHLRIFTRMTALENVMVGLHGRIRTGFTASMLRLPWVRREERNLAETARETLDFVGLGGQAYRSAGLLPYGDQKRLALARALVSRPRLLFLDEPVAGLNVAETRRMGEIIASLRGPETAVVLVEHDMSLVMRVSDRVVVLCSGKKIADGPPAEIQSHPEVIRSYLGGGEEFGLHA